MHETLTAFQLGFSLGTTSNPSPLQEKGGVVYTKPWVVEMIVDLAGYTPNQDLATAFAVEPAAGNGAFLVPMVRRLVVSCRTHKRSLLDAADALLAYELDQASAETSQEAVCETLRELGASEQEAAILSQRWIRIGDYLFDGPTLPSADFVIGNPPYIRLEDMDEGVASAYRKMYRTMTGRADIYVAFFEAALRQLKPQGVCAFICADRWMLNQYGTELRRLIANSYGVETVIEMHNADAFLEEVSAYPAITVIRRAGQGSVVVASATRGVEQAGVSSIVKTLGAIRENSTPAPINGLTATRVERWFADADPWPTVSPKRLALLNYLEEHFEPLESQATGTKVGIGVATGADVVFITTNPDLVEPSRLLPLAMAHDIKAGVLCWSGHFLIDPWMPEGLVELDQFPKLSAYFERHQAALKRRHVAKKRAAHWYRTIDRVNHDLAGKTKLYIPDIKDRIEPVLDQGKTYPHHNIYFVQSERWDHEVLGGLLLSAIGQFFVECYGVRMRGGYLRFQAQYLRRIRVPQPAQISAQQADQLKAAFRTRDRELATRVALEVYGIDELPLEKGIGP